MALEMAIPQEAFVRHSRYVNPLIVQQYYIHCIFLTIHPFIAREQNPTPMLIIRTHHMSYLARETITRKEMGSILDGLRGGWGGGRRKDGVAW